MVRGLNYYYLRDSYNGVLPRPTLEKPRVFMILMQRELLQTIYRMLVSMCTLTNMTIALTDLILNQLLAQLREELRIVATCLYFSHLILLALCGYLGKLAMRIIRL